MFRRYRIVATAAPGVTAQDSFSAKPKAFDGAMYAECF